MRGILRPLGVALTETAQPVLGYDHGLKGDLDRRWLRSCRVGSGKG